MLLKRYVDIVFSGFMRRAYVHFEWERVIKKALIGMVIRQRQSRKDKDTDGFETLKSHRILLHFQCVFADFHRL